MSKATGLTRGDRNRNRRLERLRMLVPTTHAVLGIDLADKKQAAALTDHDSRVLARKRMICRAWQLGPLLDWAAEQAQAAGYESITVACEATGHRWQVLQQQAAERGLAMVCVQGLQVCRAREREDLTFDKSDPKDAMLIARLTTQLHCYEPEVSDETWSRLRQLGARRRRLLTESTASTLQLRDLLECVWPAALEAAAKPLESASWCAALAVVLRKAQCGDLAPARRMGLARFTAAVQRELPAWGATRICRRIITGLFNALDDVVGVISHRHGVLERAEFVVDDWRAIRVRRDEVETRMLNVLDALELTDLLGSIPGVSLIGAAAMLAETGDPARFTSARALVKHSGLCPRENSSGEHRGRSRLSGRGRPELRTAAWCAAWGAQHGNPVLAARHAHLTGRERNRLSDGQARAACAATLLRWLHAIVTRRVPFDADIAAGRRQPTPTPAASGSTMAA